jgi:broad specificity phosphatase PhoE
VRYLILGRHGNTFNEGDPVVWVGAKNDLPLVEKGVQQAEHLARNLAKAHIDPGVIYCSPLERTRRYAEIVKIERVSKAEIIVDHRLLELDYGSWSGLTDNEVGEKFSEDELRDWKIHGVWPKHNDWSDSEEQVERDVQSFAYDIAHNHHNLDVVLVISSSGRLRHFLKLIGGAYQEYAKRETLGLKTGNISVLAYQSGHFSLICWNEDPSELLSLPSLHRS